MPTYCEIHQHAKWCEHNGGVMGATGWEAPATAPALDLDAAEMRAAGFRGVFRVMAYDSGDEVLEYIDAGASHDDLDTDDVSTVAQFACDDAVQHAIVDTLNAAPALIAEVRRLRALLAEARELADNIEHESTCSIGPYGSAQNGADCDCLVGDLAAALEAL